MVKYRQNSDSWVGCEETYPGSDYTDEEREFIIAMDRYKVANDRPFPTWREVLLVLISLGYRRTAAPEEVKERSQ